MEMVFHGHRVLEISCTTVWVYLKILDEMDFAIRKEKKPLD